jgi:hypothetical protein
MMRTRARSLVQKPRGTGRGPADDFARRDVEETQPLITFLWCVAASTGSLRAERGQEPRQKKGTR